MELKFKVGDKVDCILDSEGFREWKNVTVIEVDPKFKTFPYTCGFLYGEKGLFSENELEFAE